MNKTELNFSSQWDVYSARTDWAPTVLKLIHTATPDKTKLSCLCRFRFGAVNWIVKTVADWKFEVRTRSQQSSNLHRDTRDDKTVAPACRPSPRRRRPGRQLRLAARPPTRSDVVRHVKRKHAVDCCIWQTKRHATTVIYRLTVLTFPDGLETQFTPPDTTPTALSRRVWWRAVWTGN